MTFMSPTASTRRAKPSHEPWAAHQYQRRAVEHLTQQAVAALFLDPGLGKTSIVLAAFRELRDAGLASRMLVVAPLRVCQTVWRQEGQKWTEFRDLRFSLLHGPKKAERLKDDADVWLINPEGVDWLATQYFGRQLPFDTVVIDELTKFKNPSAKRCKALRKRIERTPRKWGLTGTPAPNGYEDLFGQFLILDGGAVLGKYVTHFRDNYFQVDYDGYTYNLMPGAEKRIEAKIKPYVLRMSAEDYLELPPLVDDVRELDMEPGARATYSKMKKDMIAELPEGVVTGANAAAVYSKLKQMANGAVYVGDGVTGPRKVSAIHTTKLEALDELIEELAGQQLLLAYEFNHDLSRLQAHYGDKLHHLGRGEAADTETIAAWNRGEIGLLACHPASAAHGLNLQYSGCGHVAWFSPIWDLELYQQFIRRILRQGNEAQRIINHLFVVRDTIDELALVALRDKDTTQERLLQSLNSEITGDKETVMAVAKLSRQNDTQATEQVRKVPKGWGVATAAATVQEPAAQPDQRARIQATIAPVRQPEIEGDVDEAEQGPTPAERARAAFSPQVQKHMVELGGGSVGTINPSSDQVRDYAKAHQPAQIDIEDVAPTTQRPVQTETEATAPTKSTRTRRPPAASTGDDSRITRSLDGDTAELRLSLLNIAQGDVAKARSMLEFVTGA